jgi:hypothetical protein
MTAGGGTFESGPVVGLMVLIALHWQTRQLRDVSMLHVVPAGQRRLRYSGQTV